MEELKVGEKVTLEAIEQDRSSLEENYLGATNQSS